MSTNDPDSSTRIVFLLAGIGCFAIFAIQVLTKTYSRKEHSWPQRTVTRTSEREPIRFAASTAGWFFGGLFCIFVYFIPVIRRFLEGP